MAEGSVMKAVRKWGRTIHRDLSFFFSGMVIIYAMSGIMLNHKDDFNSDYSVSRHRLQAEGAYPKAQSDFTKESVAALLEPIGETENFTKHYFPEPHLLKVFLKGGSSLVVDIRTGDAVYEKFRKRHVISAFNRLHYNRSKGWTVFADVFATALILITVTGLVIVRGPKGLRGRGGIELIAGILIPLIFILWF